MTMTTASPIGADLLLRAGDGTRPPGRKLCTDTAGSSPRRCVLFDCRMPTHSTQCRQHGFGWPSTPTRSSIRSG